MCFNRGEKVERRQDSHLACPRSDALWLPQSAAARSTSRPCRATELPTTCMTWRTQAYRESVLLNLTGRLEPATAGCSMIAFDSLTWRRAAVAAAESAKKAHSSDFICINCARALLFLCLSALSDVIRAMLRIQLLRRSGHLTCMRASREGRGRTSMFGKCCKLLLSMQCMILMRRSNRREAARANSTKRSDCCRSRASK